MKRGIVLGVADRGRRIVDGGGRIPEPTRRAHGQGRGEGRGRGPQGPPVLKSRRSRDNLYMITGGGGNTGSVHHRRRRRAGRHQDGQLGASRSSTRSKR